MRITNNAHNTWSYQSSLVSGLGLFTLKNLSMNSSPSILTHSIKFFDQQIWGVKNFPLASRMVENDLALLGDHSLAIKV